MTDLERALLLWEGEGGALALPLTRGGTRRGAPLLTYDGEGPRSCAVLGQPIAQPLSLSVRPEEPTRWAM